jgi:hypothetical protein
MQPAIDRVHREELIFQREVATLMHTIAGN